MEADFDVVYVTCDCGSIVTEMRYPEHLKTNKHNNFIERRLKHEQEITRIKENEEDRILHQMLLHEKKNERRREKITCECGCIISRNAILYHKYSDKHKNKLKQQNIESNKVSD